MRRAPAGRRHRVSGSLSLPSRGPFHLSLTVLIAIGHWSVFSLGGWSPRLPTGFLVSRGTPDPAVPSRLFGYGALALSGRLSQSRSPKVPGSSRGPLPRHARTPVWAPPVSLAATSGIDFSFLSSGYLDVSVPRVPPACLWIGHAVHEVCSCGFPHSDVRGSRDICSSPRLFAAYRVLHRPPVPGHPPCALVRLTRVSLLTLGSLFRPPFG